LAQILLNGVRVGTNFAKWAKHEEFLPNGVIIVTNDKLEGKKMEFTLCFISGLTKSYDKMESSGGGFCPPPPLNTGLQCCPNSEFSVLWFTNR
jgi:hypothetical protein